MGGPSGHYQLRLVDDLAMKQWGPLLSVTTSLDGAEGRPEEIDVSETSAGLL